VRAASAAGHGARVRDLVGNDQPLVAGEDVELILWAADYGALHVLAYRLDAYLPSRAESGSADPVRASLEIARGWMGAEPVAELRRRLADADAVAERDTVQADFHGEVDRVRVTAADGRWAEVQTAHPAIVTHLEVCAGIDTSRDQLMARALMDRDSDSVNWVESWYTVRNKPDAEATVRWAAGVLADPDPDARRFAAEVLHSLAIDPAPARAEALTILRSRLTAEPDAGVLVSLIAAGANYHGPGTLPEIVAHAGNPDPRVRRQVAQELGFALLDPASVPEGTGLLAELGVDPDGRVRVAALRALRSYAFDHPVTGQVVAANRDDPDPGVRPEVLMALSQGGDREACAELTRLGAEAGQGSQLAMMAHDAKRWIVKAESSDPDPHR